VGCNFFLNGGVDEKDVIIMTQRKHINDLENSLKVVEKRLQLVTGFTCVLLLYYSYCYCV